MSILRPGFLDRGELQRGMEQLFMKFASNIKVRHCASDGAVGDT